MTEEHSACDAVGKPSGLRRGAYSRIEIFVVLVLPFWRFQDEPREDREEEPDDDELEDPEDLDDEDEEDPDDEAAFA